MIGFRTLCTKMSTMIENGRHLIAVGQLTSNHDMEANFKTCVSLVKRAKERNCEMVFFPECFDYLGKNREETMNLDYSKKDIYIEKFRQLARDHNLWISLGGFLNKDGNDDKLPQNTYLVLDSNGHTQAVYKKLHLFDLDLPGKVRLMESEFSRCGQQLVRPVKTPVGQLGLSICYDLRFPELALWNRYQGAQVLSYPSAFTLNTGLAHWEALLRARAIETQCYVVAAAQTGKHNDKRSSYGHSMVVDPWGAVIAQCSETVDLCFAEINLDYVKEVRTVQPVMEHRRSDLYFINYNSTKKSDHDLQFDTNPVPASTIFYQSEYSFAFVNLKPIIEGHVLVSPVRRAERLSDLSDIETADLFITVKKVQRVIEKYHETNSSTVCIQDGPNAGQTVKHVHVHVIPRKKCDFGDNTDNLYKILESEQKREPRSIEDMASEAVKYQNLF